MQQNCFYIGSIFKLHGYKGNLIIYNENDFSFNYKEIKYLFIKIDNIFIPFFLDRISPNKTKNILIKIEDIDSEEKAKKLLNNDVFFPNKYQPKNIETEEKNNNDDGPKNQDSSQSKQQENNEEKQIEIDQNVENILNAMKENEKVNKKRKQNNFSNESGKEW